MSSQTEPAAASALSRRLKLAVPIAAPGFQKLVATLGYLRRFPLPLSMKKSSAPPPSTSQVVSLSPSGPALATGVVDALPLWVAAAICAAAFAGVAMGFGAGFATTITGF